MAAGIVLCGGLSRRMGAPKALLPFGPETMLQRVVRLLATVTGPIVVVAAPGQALPALPPGCIVARDAAPRRGPLEALRAGLRALPASASAAFVAGCDAPLLAPAFAAAMIALLPGYDIAVLEQDGFPHPLAAAYRRDVLAHVEALLAADRMRMALLLDLVRTRRVTPEEMRSVDPSLQSLRNLNTPREYAAALAAGGWAGVHRKGIA